MVAWVWCWEWYTGSASGDGGLFLYKPLIASHPPFLSYVLYYTLLEPTASIET